MKKMTLDGSHNRGCVMTKRIEIVDALCYN